jgi:hypothetical protein
MRTFTQKTSSHHCDSTLLAIDRYSLAESFQRSSHISLSILGGYSHELDLRSRHHSKLDSYFVPHSQRQSSDSTNHSMYLAPRGGRVV